MIQLTSSEERILSTLQNRISLRQPTSLENLAAECYVAKSTIIKLAKRLGYDGFVEMYHYYRNRQAPSTQNDTMPFENDLVVGDLRTTLRELALKLLEYEDCKIILCTTGAGTMIDNEMLGQCIARKMNLLDLIAFPSYDYLMAQPPRREKGIAFFLDISNKKKSSMLELTRREGFYLVGFSDQADSEAKTDMDYFVQLVKTEYRDANFYFSKLLIFFEMLLSEYANLSLLSLEETDESDQIDQNGNDDLRTGRGSCKAEG